MGSGGKTKNEQKSKMKNPQRGKTRSKRKVGKRVLPGAAQREKKKKKKGGKKVDQLRVERMGKGRVPSQRGKNNEEVGQKPVCL